MSTGGLASLIASQPHEKPGVLTLGYVLYITNLVVFTGISVIMVLRFVFHPELFVRSIKHKREGLFLPTFFLSIAMHITGAHKFLVQEAHKFLVQQAHQEHRNNLISFLAAVFWIYSAATFFLAVLQYSYLFAGPKYPLHKMVSAAPSIRRNTFDPFTCNANVNVTVFHVISVRKDLHTDPIHAHRCPPGFCPYFQ